MDDRALAEIFCQAFIMVVRGLNKKFDLDYWILSRHQRREILHALQNDTSESARTIERMLTEKITCTDV